MIIGVFALMGFQIAYASSSCKHFAQKTPNLKLNFVFNKDVKNPKLVEYNFRKLINEVFQGYTKGISFKNTPDIRVQFKEIANGQFYNSFSNSLLLSTNIESGGPLKSPRQMVSIKSHEIGHLIFHHYLYTNSKLYSNNFKIRHAEIKRKEKWKLLKLENQGISWSQYVETKESKKANLDKLFVKAYDEFFADVISILKMEDLNAMSEVFRGLDKDHFQYRSFTRELSPKGWDWMTPHFVLAPTRSHLGQLITSIGGPQKLKNTRFAKDLLDILIKEINAQRRQTYRQYKQNPNLKIYEYEFSPQAMNINLMSAIAKMRYFN